MEDAIQHDQLSDFRYETVARFINELIDSGSLQPGDKVPSLRKVSKARDVSVTTALHAYRMLESQGVLEAQPQSGFYVRRLQHSKTDTPQSLPVPTRAQTVKTAGQVANMFELAGDLDYSPLGCAIPAPELLATSQLDKFLSRAARIQGMACNTYAPPAGVEALRASIARRSMHWGQVTSGHDIVIANGCTEALHLALKTLTKPGDTIAVESPNYFGFLPVLQALHLKVAEIPTDAIDGLSANALETVLKKIKITACLFSSSFNNPLGSLTADSRKMEIIALLEKFNIPLIEDDVYGDIYFGSERPRPFSTLADSDNIIYCSSFSKTLAPGYRIGWISSPRYADKIRINKYATTLCNPVLTQVAMSDYLDGGAYDNHLRRLRRAFKANLNTMTSAISETFPEGTRISRPEGGFVLWVELPEQCNTRSLFEQVLKHGICFAPGDLFTTSGGFNSCLRISCGYPWSSSIERAVWKLGEMAKEQLEG